MRHSLLFAALMCTAAPASAAGWDVYAGGINGNQLSVDLGFSTLPRVTFEHQLTRHFALGVEAAFDYAYWVPQQVFTPGVTLGFPMRVSAYNRGRISFGLRFEPGLMLQFTDPNLQFAVLLNAGLNVGGWVVPSFLIGGGIDAPIAVIALPASRVGGAYAVIPLLFGPIFEFHPGHLFALTFDVKLGPNINTNGGVQFALKALLGVAFHFN